MRLGLKLMLAFLLLAVVPLSSITIYSYNTSIKAFRKAVEAEGGALAEDMGGRMESLKTELAHRVERLSRFPFSQLMAVKGEKIDPKSNPLMAQLMAEIGDAAPLVDSLEFSPAPQDAPKADAAGPSSHAAARSALAPLVAQTKDLQNLVIHLMPETAKPSAENPPAPPGAQPEGLAMHMRPMLPPLQPGGHPPAPGEAELQRREALLKQIKAFQIVLEKVEIPIPRSRQPDRAAAPAAGTRTGSGRGSAMQMSNPLANNFGSEVLVGSDTVGTVRARMSQQQIFRSVLAGSRRRQGEIPFVVDSGGGIHTVSPSDEKRLAVLNLKPADGGVLAAPERSSDWVVVARKDEATDVTFGIARPISEPLREIRRTAGRNLGYGLALVGLALFGIIPLSRHMTRDLAALTHGAEQLAMGNLNARVPVRSRDEIGKLAESFNRMARDLGEHQTRLVEQERLRKELEMSRRIQAELLPKQPLQEGPVEVKGISIPAQEVGGDFFNYFPLPGGDVAILVGDVSGKGVAAALLMANLQATLQARLALAPDLDRLAAQLDEELEASTPREVYLTLFMAILNHRQGRLRYVNAGHIPQLALRSSGEIERLESTGRPLGLLSGGGYVQREVRLGAGDALFLYTDGLVEARDASGNEFGQERVEALLRQGRSTGISQILVRIEEEVRRHRGQTEAADDTAMLVLKFGEQTHDAARA